MDDTGLIDVLVDMWGTATLDLGHRTKCRNVEIKNPWLNVLACPRRHGSKNTVRPLDRRRTDEPHNVIYGDKKRHSYRT